MLQQRQKALAMAPSTRDPKRTSNLSLNELVPESTPGPLQGSALSWRAATNCPIHGGAGTSFAEKLNLIADH
jgi:hypothetical protein